MSLGVAPSSVMVRFWPVTVGVLGLLLGLAVVLVVWVIWWAGQPRQTPPRTVSTLAALQSVELRAGYDADLEVLVERSGPDEGLEVRFTNLPTGVSCPEVMVPPGSGQARVKAHFRASIDIADSTALVPVSLWRGDRQIDQKLLSLVARKFLRPRLGKMPDIRLSRGESTTLVVPVTGNGNTDPWTLRVNRLPPGVTMGSARQRAARDAVVVEFSTRDDAPLGGSPIHVTLYAGKLVADEQHAWLSVEEPKNLPAIDLKLDPRRKQTILVRAGATTTVTVQVGRGNYSGPIQVRVVGLPPGVTVEPVTVPRQQYTAELEFRAEPNIAARWPRLDPVVSIRALVRGRQVGKEAVLLKREPPPREVKRPREPSNPVVRQTIPAPVEVKIPTADGLKLAGTFYPSPSGTAGPCVLLLHDIGPGNLGRRAREQVRLALLLQKQGCAVLTFDFRGYGENLSSKDRIEPGFFKSVVNASLVKGTSFQDLARTQTMRSMNHRFFPGAYLPWLVQDIVAARLALDLLHDDEKVNSANLLVIGEGEGAGLGAIWLATECCRYRKGKLVPSIAPPRLIYESRDLQGAVWIDVRPGGRFPAPVRLRVSTPAERERTWPPMVMLYNQNTQDAAAQTRAWVKAFRQPAGSEKAVDGPQSGSLLQVAGVHQAIADHVKTLLKKHTLIPWAKRGVRAAGYIWNLESGGSSPAKAAGERIPALAPLDQWGFKGLTARTVQ
jgi:pimeloyl-ACP methyl ester carboxylesterase